MQIKLMGDNLEIQDYHYEMVRKHLEQKLEKYLTTFDPDLTIVDVKISEGSRWGHKVNFSMVLPGKVQVYAEAKDENLATAFRTVRQKVEQQLKEYRGRLGINQQASQTGVGKINKEEKFEEYASGRI